MTDTREPVRFYFSFRSPYSWLAMLRIEQALAKLPVRLEYLPVFPPPDFPNDPAAVPNKLKYIQLDTARIAQEYGFPTQPLGALDTNWVRPTPRISMHRIRARADRSLWTCTRRASRAVWTWATTR